MPPKSTITVGPLKGSEMDEADRLARDLLRLAEFGWRQV
jgi:hypothetical protein